MGFLRKVFVILLSIHLFIFNFELLVNPVHASASSPWTQTDWSGGSGQTGWSDQNKYSSSMAANSSTPGSVSLNLDLNVGDGADGAITVPADKNINTDTMISGRSCTDGGDAVNYSVTTSILAGTTSLTLASTPTSGCLAIGDEVLIINLQGTSSNNSNVGKYESVTVTGISDADLTIDRPLTNAYDGTTQKIMVQRVPNYTNVTIDSGKILTAAAWNSTKGGLLFFRANGTVTNNGTISMNGKGFLAGSGAYPGGEGGEDFGGRGGHGGYWGTAATAGRGGGGGGTGAAQGGTSTTGGTGQTGGAGGGGGGGASYSSSRGAGGGGGGYGTVGAGGQTLNSNGAQNGSSGSGTTGGTGGTGGGTSWNNSYGGGAGGGGTYGGANLSLLYMGASGGAGGRCTDGGGDGGNGGAGGGILFISAHSLQNNGSITSNGANGSNSIPSSGNSGGAGGGGAGGSVKLQAHTAELGISTISTTGGSGGTSGQQGHGGMGGVGRIAIAYTTSLSGSTNPTHSPAQSEYYQVATLTSSILDTGFSAGAIWDILTYAASTPANTSLSVKARTSNSSSLSGVSDFLSCSAISSGSDMSGNNCVTDGHRYVQYQIVLFSLDMSSTPTFQDISIVFGDSPPLFNLESPSHNAYNRGERPTFSFKPVSTTSGFTAYTIEIDNGDYADFSIADIPPIRNEDYDTTRYKARYEYFKDDNTTNNLISVYTKSSKDWGETANDGILKEGKRTWQLKARYSNGNEQILTRILLIDRTAPILKLHKINDRVFSPTMSTTDTTPTIYGMVTDSLAGDKAENKVASGPKKVEVQIERANNTGKYDVYLTDTVLLSDLYFSSTNKKIADNSQQSNDKYANFIYTSSEQLPYGKYKLTIKGTDIAGNMQSSTPVTLSIISVSQITTSQEKQIIQEETQLLKPEEQKEIMQELEITKPTNQVPKNAPITVSPSASDQPKASGSSNNSIFDSIGSFFSDLFK